MVSSHRRAFVAAITFLTRIPASGLGAHDLADLSRAAPYFPIVGLIVGGVGALGLYVGSMVWPPTLAVLVSMSATVLLTGAFHEDALADAFDGFGGGWSTEQVLAIMKDSRVGSYALVGVALVLGAKAAALVTIANDTGILDAGRALIVGHVLGRWSSVPLIRYHSYVRVPSAGERSGVGRPFVDSVTAVHLAAATITATIVAIAMLGMRSLVVGLAALVVTALAGRFFRRRIGGITGDALGAANQLVEVTVYLVLAAHWSK